MEILNHLGIFFLYLLSGIAVSVLIAYSANYQSEVSFSKIMIILFWPIWLILIGALVLLDKG